MAMGTKSYCKIWTHHIHFLTFEMQETSESEGCGSNQQTSCQPHFLLLLFKLIFKRLWNLLTWRLMQFYCIKHLFMFSDRSAVGDVFVCALVLIYCARKKYIFFSIFPIWSQWDRLTQGSVKLFSRWNLNSKH